MEEGMYGIWIGNSLEHAKVEASIELDKTVILEQDRASCLRKEELEEIMNEIKHTKDNVEIENLLFKLDECINKLVDENGLFYFKAGIKFATDFYTEINDDALYNI